MHASKKPDKDNHDPSLNPALEISNGKKSQAQMNSASTVMSSSEQKNGGAAGDRA